MTSKSDFLEESLLNHIFRGSAYSAPANTFHALMTANAGETGGGTEASYGGYARVTVASSAGNWKDPATATQGQVENLIKIVWPVNIGPAEAVITGWAVYDAVSGGNLLYYVDVTDFTVKILGQPVIHENQLVVAEA